MKRKKKRSTKTNEIVLSLTSYSKPFDFGYLFAAVETGRNCVKSSVGKSIFVKT